MVHYQELILFYSQEETDQADIDTEFWGSSRYNLIIEGRCSCKLRLMLVFLKPILIIRR